MNIFEFLSESISAIASFIFGRKMERVTAINQNISTNISFHFTPLHFTTLHSSDSWYDFFFDCILHRIILVYILHAWRTSTHKYQLPPICLLCACHIVYIAMSFFFLFYFWNVFDMKCIHYDSCQGSRVVQRMRGSRTIERNCAKTNRNIRRVKENEKTKTGEAKNNDWQSANEWIE